MDEPFTLESSCGVLEGGRDPENSGKVCDADPM